MRPIGTGGAPAANPARCECAQALAGGTRGSTPETYAGRCLLISQICRGVAFNSVSERRTYEGEQTNRSVRPQSLLRYKYSKKQLPQKNSGQVQRPSTAAKYQRNVPASPPAPHPPKSQSSNEARSRFLRVAWRRRRRRLVGAEERATHTQQRATDALD